LLLFAELENGMIQRYGFVITTLRIAAVLTPSMVVIPVKEKGIWVGPFLRIVLHLIVQELKPGTIKIGFVRKRFRIVQLRKILQVVDNV
jgi:hypothetical protein